MSVATWEATHDPNDDRYWESNGDGSPGEYNNPVWSPHVGHQKSFPDVPEPIADTATEAWTCRVTGAHRGAVMLARAAVESTAKAKGVTGGNLQNKIEEMATKGLIRSAVAEQGHEIRHVGNSSAHGDLEESVDPEEADEVLHLMEEVLNEVFQSPAKSERLAARREERKQKKSSQ